MVAFKFTISGTGRGGVNWLTRGTVRVENQGQFTEALRQAQQRSFEMLTGGEAEYGHPGEGGCSGPYKIERFSLELVP